MVAEECLEKCFIFKQSFDGAHVWTDIRTQDNHYKYIILNAYIKCHHRPLNVNILQKLLYPI